MGEEQGEEPGCSRQNLISDPGKGWAEGMITDCGGYVEGVGDPMAGVKVSELHAAC